MPFLSFDDLKDKGVTLSRSQIHRLVKAKKFPAPIKLSNGPHGPNSWDEAEIDDHLEALKAARASKAA